MAVIVMVIVIVEKILPILPISSGDFFSFFFFIANIGISFYISLLIVLFLKKHAEKKFSDINKKSTKHFSPPPKTNGCKSLWNLQSSVLLYIMYNVLVQPDYRINLVITRWFFPHHPSLLHLRHSHGP